MYHPVQENLCMVAAAGFFHGKNPAIMEVGLINQKQVDKIRPRFLLGGLSPVGK